MPREKFKEHLHGLNRKEFRKDRRLKRKALRGRDKARKVKRQSAQLASKDPWGWKKPKAEWKARKKERMQALRKKK